MADGMALGHDPLEYHYGEDQEKKGEYPLIHHRAPQPAYGNMIDDAYPHDGGHEPGKD